MVWFSSRCSFAASTEPFPSFKASILFARSSVFGSTWEKLDYFPRKILAPFLWGSVQAALTQPVLLSLSPLARCLRSLSWLAHEVSPWEFAEC